MKNKLVHRFVIGTFVSLYLLVSVISTIHVIEFFKLSNPQWLAVSLAIAFELGAAASLASLIILDKMNKGLVWILFTVITLMQMQGNMYYAFVHMENFQGWSELFGIIEEDVIYQKRILSAVSGAILPLVALGFIKSLVDYIKPEQDKIENKVEEILEEVEEKVEEKVLLHKEELASEEDIPKEAIGDLEEVLPEVVSREQISVPRESYDQSEKIWQDEIIEDEIIEEIAEEVSPVMAEEEISAILDEPQLSNPRPMDSIPGYYGDIVIDGNGIVTEESGILPVNSNKRRDAIDDSAKVSINPTRL
jgi:hypothetical protein